MKNIAMLIRYDGTNYHGWQRQKNGISVQQAVETALSALTGETVEITGCSRTDAGVHAMEYLFHFHSGTEIPTERLPYALNYHLPKDISALSAWEMPEEFHARFSAKGKRYIYRIWNSGLRNPFVSRYSWQMPYRLDVDAMIAAAPILEGTHDFSSFMAAGGSQKTTVRTVRLCRVERDPEQRELITITVEADAFLYNMVRIITGTLVEIGLHRIRVEELPAILASCDRKRCGMTAPPQGLFLKKVYYDFRESKE
ncbi:MAG: tRNA pseudouridine(38-40) synthase TruA [Clostridia bacterium]|nr:tRNA pseudouridine(38-40) synthase TruA [Clostridia bacterium]